MAALVQSYPQTGSMTVLQQRPRSTGSLQAITMQSQQHPHHHRDDTHRRTSSMVRSYRGQQFHVPVVPYGYGPAVPQQLNRPPSWRRSLPPGGLPDPRLFSQSQGQSNSMRSQRAYPPVPVGALDYQVPTLKGRRSHSRDETPTSRPAQPNRRPKSAVLSPSSSFERPSSAGRTFDPRQNERYRRRLSQGPPVPHSGAVPAMPSVHQAQMYAHSSRSLSSPTLVSGSTISRTSSPSSAASGASELPKPPVLSQQMRKGSMDDISSQRQAQLDKARRMRRQSVQSLDRRQFANAKRAASPLASPTSESPYGSMTNVSEVPAVPVLKKERSFDKKSVKRPGSAHSRLAAAFGIRPSSSSTTLKEDAKEKKADRKRMTLPSPLSRPVTSDGITGGLDRQRAKRTSSFSRFMKPQFFAPESRSVSAPIIVPQPEEGPDSELVPKKGLRSRLRRAFSFSSTAELRRAAVESKKQQDMAASRKQREDRLTARSEEMYEQQEIPPMDDDMLPPPVLDGSIYRHPDASVTGSTDNFSISSTASSASLILRKMGQSMRRRSKSVKGVFAISKKKEDSTEHVDRDIVDAECAAVNVNYDVSEHPAGETDYPRLERNSIDAATASAAVEERPVSHRDEATRSLRNIVSGERADGTPFSPKSILKRAPGSESGNVSPVTPPDESRAPELESSGAVQESPSSSRPETPADDGPRSDSVAIAGDNYFGDGTLASSREAAVSAPALLVKFNVTFNARLQFHDTWPSMEYDRRGDVATCNRLTPMLAQQIKEELNTFKMEMEVHEASKMYTHFF